MKVYIYILYIYIKVINLYIAYENFTNLKIYDFIFSTNLYLNSYYIKNPLII